MAGRGKRAPLIRSKPTKLLGPQSTDPASLASGTQIAPLVTIPAEIDKILYRILTLQDLEELGSPEIHNFKDETLIKGNIKSLLGSLYDPRMGYSSYSKGCNTCDLPQAECPGHNGFIRFPPNFYLVNPFGGKLVAFLLLLFCQNCAFPLFDEDDLAGQEKLPMLTKVRRLLKKLPVTEKSQVCPKCKRKNLEAKFVLKELGIHLIDTTTTTKSKSLMDNTKVYQILSSIDQKNTSLLGFDEIGYHPRDLMMSFISVVPPAMREITAKGFGVKSKDYLGKAYKSLGSVITDMKIREKAPPKPKKRSDKPPPDPRVQIVNRVLSIFGMRKTKNSNTKDEIRGYKQLLSNKKGHIRGKMQGKRIDFTTRTPAIPNPLMGLDQIGVPLGMVWPPTENTIYARVPITRFNRHLIEEAFREGKITRYFSRRGREHRIVPEKQIVFREGDEVGMTDMDGIDIMFNRNPSIHRLSNQSMRFVLVEGQAFQVNPANVTQFNMDFDGDEGNVKVLMRYTSRAEARYIASSVANPVNPESHTSSNGLIQDNISAAYMMTNPHDIPFQDVRVLAILEELSNEVDQESLERRLALCGLTIKSPRGFISATFPATFSYRSGDVEIVRGVLIKGTLTKKHLGPGTGASIPLYLSHYDYIYGVRRVQSFIMDMGLVTGTWLSEQRGFTISHDDTHVGDPRMDLLRGQVAQEVKRTLRSIDYHPTDDVDKARVEQEVTGVVNRGESMGTKVIDEIMDPWNPVRVSIISGAKGNKFHSSNIAGLIGQQFVLNERPKLELTDGTRVSVYSFPDSDDPADRGFSVDNYGIGLDPLSTLIQQASTRPLLADTSLKTGEVGDLSHRIGLALENFVVQYDGTLRDHLGIIAQFISGTEGFNPERLLPSSTGDAFPMDLFSMADIANAEYEASLLGESFTVDRGF